MRPRIDRDSSRATSGTSKEDRAYLSIGGLSRSTGVSIETLRTWELRYGFPRPIRKPSGHRQFEIDNVDRIRRIVRALELGFRAGEVVPASDQTLSDLLSTLPDQAVTLSVAPPQNPKAMLDLVRNFDGDRLMRSLRSSLAHQDPVAYVETRIAPCLEAIGAAWAAGELEIAHEHFASERISDVLRETRLRFEETAHGPFVVLATVPGESHGLGLQVTALILSSVGLRVLGLGTEVPVKETAALAIRNAAAAVGISISAATRNTAPEALTRLRAHLPRKIDLILGGSGAPTALKGAKVLTDLQALRAWAKAIA